MKIIAIIYLALWLLTVLTEPFLFGRERTPYTPTAWVIRIVLGLPLYWMLFVIATS